MAENETVTTITGEPAKEPAEPKEDSRDKRISDLERKLGEQGRQLGEQDAIIENARAVAQVITGDDELIKKYTETWNKKYGVQAQQESKDSDETGISESNIRPDSELTSKVNSMEADTRFKKIREFEDKYGISNMPEEDAKKVKQQIASKLAVVGQTIKTLPISALEESLEMAYISSNPEALKQEGAVEARSNAYGAIPSMSSGRMNEPEIPTLSPKQREYAEKFKVDPEKAAKHLGEEVTTVV